MRGEIVGMSLRQQSARYEQIECRCIWLITVIITSVDGWKLRSKPPRPSKKPWTIFNKCSLNSSLTDITMILGVIIMTRNIMMISNLRLRSQRKVLLSILKFL